MNEIVYLNGSLIPVNQAIISPVDYGFLYGFGLFETMRAYEGKVSFLDRHLSRLARSTETLGLLAITFDIEKAVKDTLVANKLGNARIRVTVSAGEGGAVPDPATCKNPTVLITARQFEPYPEQTYEKGFKAVISSIRRNSQSPLSRLKSTNYLENLMAKREAKTAGADEALFLNERDLVAEASMSNVFIVSDGILKTPRVENGILPGVTRETVLQLAPKLGIETVTDDIWLDDIFEAQEAFLTNTLLEVMPLTKVARNLIGSGKPGPVTRKLRQAYRELVKSE
ncbi:MAG: aminotransferase class IV [Dehalococcoidales bacterium]|nr:aminotransferase class IV [Dehalococcoidales bacterium]